MADINARPPDEDPRRPNLRAQWRKGEMSGMGGASAAAPNETKRTKGRARRHRGKWKKREKEMAFKERNGVKEKGHPDGDTL